jgi:hypothetical protein
MLTYKGNPFEGVGATFRKRTPKIYSGGTPDA